MSPQDPSHIISDNVNNAMDKCNCNRSSGQVKVSSPERLCVSLFEVIAQVHATLGSGRLKAVLVKCSDLV